MDNTFIDKVLEFNFLGIHFNEQLNWKSHKLIKLSVKCCRSIGILNRLKIILPLNIKSIVYNSLMLQHLNDWLHYGASNVNEFKNYKKSCSNLKC